MCSPSDPHVVFVLKLITVIRYAAPGVTALRLSVCQGANVQSSLGSLKDVCHDSCLRFFRTTNETGIPLRLLIWLFVTHSPVQFKFLNQTKMTTICLLVYNTGHFKMVVRLN